MGTLETRTGETLVDSDFPFHMKLPEGFKWPDEGTALDEGWLQKPTCDACYVVMQPIGRGGWWCEPCQEFQ